MTDGITAHANPKKPNGNIREAHLFLDSDGPEKPHGDPDEIEGYEEFTRPGHEPQEFRSTHIKTGHEFLCKMEALERDPNQVQSDNSIDRAAGIFCRLSRDRQSECHDRDAVKHGGTEDHAADVFAHG